MVKMMHKLLRLLLLCIAFYGVYGQQSVDIGTEDGYETIDIYEPEGDTFSCTATSTHCNFTMTGNCNSDNCADSTYHCPTTSTCSVCGIKCDSNRICQEANIYGYSCDTLVVYASGSYVNVLKGVDIYAPYEGNLRVYVSAIQDAFRDASVYSNNSKDISIEIQSQGGQSIGTEMTIEASDATGELNIECNVDCDGSVIYCPTNDKTDGTDCIVDCSNSVGNQQCQNLDIYTTYGTPRDVKLYCPTNDDNACSNTEIFCDTGSGQTSCQMTYASPDWTCNGGSNACLLPTEAPIEGQTTPMPVPGTTEAPPPPAPETTPSMDTPETTPGEPPTNGPTHVPTTHPPTQPPTTPMPTLTFFPSAYPTVSRAPTNVPTTDPFVLGEGSNKNNNGNASDGAGTAAAIIVVFLILACCVGIVVLYRKHDKSREIMQNMYAKMKGENKNSSEEGGRSRKGSNLDRGAAHVADRSHVAIETPVRVASVASVTVESPKGGMSENSESKSKSKSKNGHKTELGNKQTSGDSVLVNNHVAGSASMSSVDHSEASQVEALQTPLTGMGMTPASFVSPRGLMYDNNEVDSDEEMSMGNGNITFKKAMVAAQMTNTSVTNDTDVEDESQVLELEDGQTPSHNLALFNLMRNRNDSENVNDQRVLDRFLVTMTITGKLTSKIKYLEALQDGSVRVLDAKGSGDEEIIYDALNLVDRSEKAQDKSGEDSEPVLYFFERDKNGKISKKRGKKRKFQFSSLVEKTQFLNLLEELSIAKGSATPTASKKHLYRPHVESRAFGSPIIGHHAIASKSTHAHKRTYTMEKFIKIENELDPVILKDCIIRRNGSVNEYFGKLVGLTNFRMIVKETFNEEHVSAQGIMNQELKNVRLSIKEFDPIIPALEVYHMSCYDLTAENDNTQITIVTKDFRSIVIDMTQVYDASLRTQYITMLKQHMMSRDERDIFAFKSYRVTCKKLLKIQSSKNSGGAGGSSSSSALVRHHASLPSVPETPRMTVIARNTVEAGMIFNELKHSRFDVNHKLRLMKREYTRLAKGFDIVNPNNNGNKKCPFRLSIANDQYSMCSTYPRLLMVPAEASDELLLLASKHRSRNRLPCIVWCNVNTNVTIARCAQPTSGITNKKSSYDEKLIGMLSHMNPHSKSYVICDCRPRINAMVNALKGKGYEETSKSYENSHIIFFDIQNIHQMRSSIFQIKKCCESQESDDWLVNLSNTKWFQHMSKILQCATRVASMVTNDKFSVLVHCSDGWDRTAQICSVSELLLDPYYRKFEGFQILVQKEWLWFGHKFADRNGNFMSMEKDKDGNIKNKDYNGKYKMDERSPIFMQFLDTVYQIMHQFPYAFEFKHNLLFEYATHVSSGRFGDFFGNCEKERDEQEYWLRTPSFFKYLDKLWAHDNKNLFRNENYIPTATVLMPKFAVKNIVLWKELYLRYTSHDKDTRKEVNFLFNINNAPHSTKTRAQTEFMFDNKTISSIVASGGITAANRTGGAGIAGAIGPAGTAVTTDANGKAPAGANRQISMPAGAIAGLGLEERAIIKGGMMEMSLDNREDSLGGSVNKMGGVSATPRVADEDDYVPTAMEQKQKYKQRIMELEAILREYQSNEHSVAATPRVKVGKPSKKMMFMD